MSAPATLEEVLVGALTPAVKELDDCVLRTRQSQNDLRDQLETLSDEIKRIGKTQSQIGNVDQYTRKLANIKRKVNIIEIMLQNIQDRMFKVEQGLMREAEKTKAARQ